MREIFISLTKTPMRTKKIFSYPEYALPTIDSTNSNLLKKTVRNWGIPDNYIWAHWAKFIVWKIKLLGFQKSSASCTRSTKSMKSTKPMTPKNEICSWLNILYCPTIQNNRFKTMMNLTLSIYFAMKSSVWTSFTQNRTTRPNITAIRAGWIICWVRAYLSDRLRHWEVANSSIWTQSYKSIGFRLRVLKRP